MDFEGTLDQYTGQILVTDIHGHILYANKALQARKGFSLKEMLNKKPGQVWGGHMQRDFYNKLWENLREKKQTFSGQVFNTSSKGDTLLEHIHIVPIFGKDGEIEYYLELEPSLLDDRSRENFERELNAVAQNQTRHPEDVLGLINRWVDSDQKAIFQNTSDAASALEFLAFRESQKEFDEDELYLHLAKEDPIYFQKIFVKYKNKVFNYLLYRLGNDVPMAEELTQDTFSRAFSSLPTFDYRKVPYLSYLLLIAHNLLVNYYRKTKPVLIEDPDTLSASLEDSDVSQEEEVQLLWEGVQHLNLVEQNIFMMKYREGLLAKEIGEKLGMTENSVKLHLSRGRKKLREYFHRFA